MIAARMLQVLGVLAIIGAGVLALTARDVTTQRIGGIDFTEARWNAALLALAVQGALGGLVLFGLGSGLADLRRLREAAQSCAPAQRNGPIDVARELRLRRSDPPHDVAARVLVGHAGDAFTSQQIAEVADAVEGYGLRDGREMSRAEAMQQADRILREARRAGGGPDR